MMRCLKGGPKNDPAYECYNRLETDILKKLYTGYGSKIWYYSVPVRVPKFCSVNNGSGSEVYNCTTHGFHHEMFVLLYIQAKKLQYQLVAAVDRRDGIYCWVFYLFTFATGG
uniref:Uncharacterized protein n=1 Tax=Romanomermis culicivorax TaxID=13658 RepID=A0A915L148_ROMCU